MGRINDEQIEMLRQEQAFHDAQLRLTNLFLSANLVGVGVSLTGAFTLNEPAILSGWSLMGVALLGYKYVERRARKHTCRLGEFF